MADSFAFGISVLLLSSVFCADQHVAVGVYLSVPLLCFFVTRLRVISPVFYLLPFCFFLAVQSDYNFPVLGQIFSQKTHLGLISLMRLHTKQLLSEFVHQSEVGGKFLSAFMVGTSLDPASNELFKQLGIYHLVVVSGLHVQFCASFMRAVLAPINVFLKNSRSRVHLRGLATFLICLFCLYFVFLSEGRASAKRALILLASKELSDIFFPGLNQVRLFVFVFLMQASFFPADFFSLGCLLSWSAYFLLWTSRKGWKGLLVTNIWLSLLGFCFFGALHPLSFLWNFFITPIFSILFSLSWAVFFLEVFFEPRLVSWFMGLPEVVLTALGSLHSCTSWMNIGPQDQAFLAVPRVAFAAILSAVACYRVNYLSKNGQL